MILDFQAKALEKAAQPHFDVNFLKFHSNLMPVDLCGQKTLIANGSIMDLPAEDQVKDIPADELVFSKSGIEYFRYLALSITERLAKDDPTAWVAPNPDTAKNEDCLRPVFNSVLQRGITLWTVLREMQQSAFPIPKDFIVFLPKDDARRDEVIRALVPFKKAQREALKAGWEDDTVAFRITQSASRPTALLMH